MCQILLPKIINLIKLLNIKIDLFSHANLSNSIADQMTEMSEWVT